MLDLHKLRTDHQDIIERLKIRNLDANELIASILELDEKRRTTQQSLDNLLAEANQLSKSVGQLFKEGKKEEAEAIKSKSADLKQASHDKREELRELEHKIRHELLQIPNAPNKKVPSGNTDEDNLELRQEGQIPKLHDNAKPHWDLASEYNIIDFELGTKITGAGFPVYRGKGAQLQRALINFFLDRARSAGYEEVLPPLLVNEDSGIGTGQLPDKDAQMYHAREDNLYLIPTAEVPVTNIYRDVILHQEDFPVKNTAYTPCFRREAGSYGKDVRGLNRLHQFDKVEIVQLTHPDHSYDVLEEMVAYVESLLKELQLPYRTLMLCGGDLGVAAAMTIDLEVFSAAQQRWLEVSSVSNFETYQANRLKLRFKNTDGKTELAHTLNGSALALPRIYASILENNQSENGIIIPEVLVPYTGFEMIQK